MATQGHKLAAAGTAALIAEPALAFAHTGGVGVIVGLAIAAAAYCAVEDVEQATGRELPTLPVPRPTPPGRHSLAYRLLHGKSTRSAQAGPDDEPDTSELT